MAVRDLSQQPSFRGEDVDDELLDLFSTSYWSASDDGDMDSEDGTDNESGLWTVACLGSLTVYLSVCLSFYQSVSQ